MHTTMSQTMDILNRTHSGSIRGRREDLDPEMTKLQDKLKKLASEEKLNREEVRNILTKMALHQVTESKGGYEFRENVKLILDLQGLKTDSRFKKVLEEPVLPDTIFTDAIKEL